MTPPEEAVARIIDPLAFSSRLIDPEVLDKFKSNALEKARHILALPEIVKMQEAQEALAVLFPAEVRCDAHFVDDAADTNLEAVITSLWHSKADPASIRSLWKIAEKLRHARETYAALQPLKKEAE